MVFSFIRTSAFWTAFFFCILPVLSVFAQPDIALVNPFLKNMYLSDYLRVFKERKIPELRLALMNEKEVCTKQSALHDSVLYKQKMETVLYQDSNVPKYIKKSCFSHRKIEDKRSHRFVQMPSHFQKQKWHEEPIQHINPFQKLDWQAAALLYGKLYTVYQTAEQNDDLVDLEMSNILGENRIFSHPYNPSLLVQALKKQESSRKRESSRNRTYREDRNGEPSQGIKNDFEAVRKQTDNHGASSSEELDKALKTELSD